MSSPPIDERYSRLSSPAKPVAQSRRQLQSAGAAANYDNAMRLIGHALWTRPDSFEAQVAKVHL